jgi:hypothetical protein
MCPAYITYLGACAVFCIVQCTIQKYVRIYKYLGLGRKRIQRANHS